MSMVFHSTQRDLPDGFAEPVEFVRALFMGLAPDGGLLVPAGFPALPPAVWARLGGMTYPEVAETLLAPCVGDAVASDAFRALLRDAYDFELPLEGVGEDVWILRLDRGPTASFKDFAARWMARMMRALRPAGTPLNLLVATSGDTGSAVGDAFRGVPGARVFLLFPDREVSPIQRLQLETLGDHVEALAVEGTFDDCQRMAKEAFLDPALRPLHLTSANSISIGRVLPQMVYYAWAWSRVARGPDEAVSFVVPSGNFGNALGCEWARRMGLPVARLVLAVNENDAFPRFLGSGNYAPVRPSRNCLSNAMNVGHPSNLARFIALFGGILDRDGRMWRAPDLDAVRTRLESVSVTDAETIDALRAAWRDRHLLLDPHGAVGYAAFGRLGRGGGGPVVLLETAHPAKFPEIVRDALGFEPEPPPALRALQARTPKSVRIPATPAALREHLEAFR
jgi:threonine synthase